MNNIKKVIPSGLILGLSIMFTIRASENRLSPFENIIRVPLAELIGFEKNEAERVSFFGVLEKGKKKIKKKSQKNRELLTAAALLTKKMPNNPESVKLILSILQDIPEDIKMKTKDGGTIALNSYLSNLEECGNWIERMEQVVDQQALDKLELLKALGKQLGYVVEI